jgi:tetratricopeptide (TPR) repeat protein
MVGGMLKRIGNYDEAYEHYRRAADLLPGNLYALVNLGVIDAIRGRQDTAMTFYRDVLRLTETPAVPTDYWAFFCRGEAGVFLGETRIASQAYLAALACVPPVEDVRSAAEQMQVFVTRGFEPKLASEMLGHLDRYITSGPTPIGVS